jgi:small subunit ribosomal protein S9
MTTAAKKTGERYIEAVGRRKTAVARVRLMPASKNEVVVNGKKLEDAFPISDLQKEVLSPFHTQGIVGKYSVSAVVNGGGIVSQAEAVRLGIARTLVKSDAAFRSPLKKEGYLKRDPRKKERKKFGLKKARKAPQWSKR